MSKGIESVYCTMQNIAFA